jgi:alpha-amylase
MKWNFNHFSGCDYDAATETKAIFRIQGDGKAWARGVDKENANYDYLMGMDLDVKHPEVREELFKWGMCFGKFFLSGPTSAHLEFRNQASGS